MNSLLSVSLLNRAPNFISSVGAKSHVTTRFRMLKGIQPWLLVKPLAPRQALALSKKSSPDPVNLILVINQINESSPCSRETLSLVPLWSSNHPSLITHHLIICIRSYNLIYSQNLEFTYIKRSI
jgi:hypothetical protein